jgi:flagellar M-ring protein FliF
VARQQSQDAVVKLNRDQQDEQKRIQQRENTEARSQRIRDMADQDPRIVALVIRQWMNSEQ